MKHSNISVFIPHIGCPNMCSFCNQHVISGAQKAPSPEEVKETCRSALKYSSDHSESEIAFFGGSFTAIPEDYRNSLLESVQDFIGDNGFKGIRISTRPDCIDEKILDDLKRDNVTSIELGCQSMSDKVLEMNERGHDSECIRRSAALIKQYGFELGLQMMTGLYGSSPETDIYTAEEIIKLRPDTVRIYPVVILRGTKLAEYFEDGSYEVYSLDDMVGLCSTLIRRFEQENIRIIKCGLHSSETVEEDMTGGYYHPAFRELCESRIFRNILEEALENTDEKELQITVGSRYFSKAIGQKRSNADHFRAKGFDLKFVPDSSLGDREFMICSLHKGNIKCI